MISETRLVTDKLLQMAGRRGHTQIPPAARSQPLATGKDELLTLDSSSSKQSNTSWLRISKMHERTQI